MTICIRPRFTEWHFQVIGLKVIQANPECLHLDWPELQIDLKYAFIYKYKTSAYRYPRVYPFVCVRVMSQWYRVRKNVTERVRERGMRKTMTVEKMRISDDKQQLWLSHNRDATGNFITKGWSGIANTERQTNVLFQEEIMKRDAERQKDIIVWEKQEAKKKKNTKLVNRVGKKDQENAENKILQRDILNCREHISC